MRGFQLWINLPAREKMKPAGYRDIPAREIPVVPLAGGGRREGDRRHASSRQARPRAGPIGGSRPIRMYFDVAPARGQRGVPRHAVRAQRVPLRLRGCRDGRRRRAPAAVARPPGCFTPGDSVRIAAGEEGARLLVLAGKPIGEPVVQYGPFVMNTREEIEQAIADYQAGRLAVAG